MVRKCPMSDHHFSPKVSMLYGRLCITLINVMSLQLALTVYDVYGPRKAIPVGGTVVNVFGKHG